MPFAEFSIESVFLRRRELLRDLALSCHEHLLEASGMTPQAQNKICGSWSLKNFGPNFSKSFYVNIFCGWTNSILYFVFRILYTLYLWKDRSPSWLGPCPVLSFSSLSFVFCFLYFVPCILYLWEEWSDSLLVSSSHLANLFWQLTQSWLAN